MHKTFLNIQNQHRLIWAITRSFLEANNYKYSNYREKRKRHWSLFEILIQIFGRLLKLTPLFHTGFQNAINIGVNRVDLQFKGLPALFQGYTILHMTDLHLDFIPGLELAICNQIGELAVDLCVLTGDYRVKIRGGFKEILSPMQRIVSGIKAKDGILATFGNHDSYQMLDCFEDMGIKALVNETIEIVRGDERIWVTGLDDPYYYYTDQAVRALEKTPHGFKIVLAHAPSMFDAAESNGYKLYLCGHTHGGQICLPGGKPIILHLRHGRKYYRGMWQYGTMTGYTSQGAGCVGIPIRFNTQSEITLFRLNRNCG